MSFQYIQPTDEQKATMQKFRDKYQALSEEIDQLIIPMGDNRGFSLAKTKLEESSFWLNKAITKNV